MSASQENQFHLSKHFSTKLPIVFGGAAISGEGGGYGFGDISESEAIDLILFAISLGVRVFDTAPIYGFGESEVRLGKALAQSRENYCIVSKAGVSWHSSKRVNMTNEPKVVQKMLEDSLRRLNSDYIDLYMIHWPDARVDIRFALEVLAKAKLEGKIKSIGLCNTHFEDLKKAKEIADIECLQGEWNPLSRNNQDIRRQAFVEEASWMSWGSLDKGILTGRVDKDRSFDKSDCRSWAPWWKKEDKTEKFKKIEALKSFLDGHTLSLLDFAVHFQKERSLNHFAIYGSRTEEQWASLIHSYHKEFPSKVLMEGLLLLEGKCDEVSS